MAHSDRSRPRAHDQHRCPYRDAAHTGGVARLSRGYGTQGGTVRPRPDLVRMEHGMLRFLSGVILGVFLGLAATALAASISGTGTLTGWSVVSEGEEVCSDPTVDTSSKEIQCD